MEQTRVDLVLLDVEMPVMNGLETLKHIKQRYPEVGVIMVSGVDKNPASITIEALEKGALDFVPKPTGSNPEKSRKILFDQLSSLFRVKTTRFAYVLLLRPTRRPAISPRRRRCRNRSVNERRLQ